MIAISSKSFSPKSVILALAQLFCPLALLAQSVTLAWDPSTSSNVTGYLLCRGTDGVNFGTQLNVGTNTTATVTGLQPGSSNYFEAVAYDANNVQSQPSNPVEYTVPTTTQTVTVAANPANAGTVTGGGSFAQGASVTVTATANSGYTFTNWTQNGTVQSSSANYSFTLATNRTLVANFNQFTYTVTASAGTNGSISPNGPQTVTTGGSITFTATAAANYQVNQWLVNGAVVQSGGSAYTLQNVTATATVAVTFSANPTLTVLANPANAGSVTGGGTFAPGSSVTVTATANSGYTFTNWTQNGIVQSTSPSYSFTLATNRTLVANFNQITYTVTASAGTNGSINPNGQQTVTTGGSITFTATPAANYQVNQWLVNGAVVQSGGSAYTMQNVTATATVAVTFSANPTLTVLANPANAGSVTGGGTFAPGSSVTVTATANSGYTFTNWTQNGTVQSSSANYGFTLATNRTLVANFNQITYTVTASAGTNGSISPNGAQTVTTGGSITFTATAASNYQVNQWLVNGAVVQSGGSTYTLQNVTATATVAVTFSANPTLTVLANPANAGSVTGGGTFAPGSSVTVTATANSGYTFTNWTQNGIVQSSSANYSFTLATNRTLVANFNQITYTVTASAGTNGSISPNGQQTVTTGGSITFTATPAANYQVNQWLVNGAVVQSGGSAYTMQNVTAAATVAVSFTANPTLTVLANPANAGSVTGGGTFAPGSSVTVTATANSGYTFTNWTQNGIVQSTSPSYSFTLATNRTLVANFNQITYTVTASAGTNGSINPNGQQTVTTGGSITFTATAAANYQVNQWLVNGAVVQSGGSTYTMQNVTATATVAVTFSANPTLTVLANPANAGSVTGGGTFAPGSSVTVTATANSGYTFTNWTQNGTVQSSSANYGFTLATNCTLVANFNQITYTVTASAGTNGSVSPNGPQTVTTGGSITFTATAAANYQVNQWLVNGSVVQNGGSTYALQNVTAAATVSVSFTANPTLTVLANPANAGIVTGGGTFAPGSSVTVTATANSGYTFTNWTQNGTVQSTSPSYSFTLATNRTLVANFNQITYTVTASAGTNGSISPNGAQTVTTGGSITFTATPAANYQVNQWLVNGAVVQSGGSTYTMQNVTAAATVSVSFTANPTLTVLANPANAGIVTGGGTFAPGSSVTVTATPNSGYTFTNWTQNGTVQSSSANYSFTLATNRTLVANFNQITYTVTASAGTNGSVSPNGPQTVTTGGSITFTATAAANYQVNQWLVNGAVVQSGGSTYTMQNVTATATVAVSFTANPTLTVLANPANAGSVTGGGTFAPGSSVTVTATANSGYTFTNWTQNGTVQSASANYSFTLATNRTLVANFNQITYTVTASAGTNGSINPNGQQTVTTGGSITFTATPAANYQVNQWLVNGAVVQSGGSTYTMQNVTATATVAVSFTANPTLTVLANPANAGSVTGGGTFAPGSSVTVTATANSGYTFTNWTQNGIVQSTSPSYSFTLATNRTLVANFNQITYTVTASAGTNGSVSPNGPQTVTTGGSITFTATAAANYQVNQWLVNGAVVQSGGSTYTLQNVTATATVAVSFSANPTLTVLANPANAGTVTGGGTFAPGSSVTVTATANSGYTFTNWTQNGIVQSTSANYSFTLATNRTLVANFNQITYTVTASAGTNGSVSPNGPQTVTTGGSITFTATAAANYQVNQWLVNGAVVQSGGSTYTLQNVTATATVAVTFTANPTLTVLANPANAGTVTGGGTFAPGSSVTVTATANSGYTFTNWTQNGTVQSASANYSFTLATNRTLVANFNQITYTVTASAGTNGSINPNGPQTVTTGGSITFTATAASNYQVNQWLVNGAVAQSGGSTYTLQNVTATATVSVSFTPITYTVTASADTNGSVSPNGPQSVATGGSITFTATPDTNYLVNQWLLNGAATQNGGSTYTLQNVTNTNTVSVNFSAYPTLTVLASPAIAGNVAGGGVFAPGSSVTVTAIANGGYVFTNWTQNGIVQSTSPNYGFALAACCSLVANFTPITYTVTATAGTNGSVSPTGPQTVVVGGSITYTAAPATNYQVNQWLLNGAMAQTGGSTYALQKVTSNDTVAVTFSRSPRVVANPPNTGFTLLVSGNGTLLPGQYGTSYRDGRQYTLTAYAGRGSVFANWTSNGTVVATTPRYTFLVESNMMLQANFILNPFTPVMATYHGLIYDTNAAAEVSSGHIVATVTSAGTYTASVRLGTLNQSFSGKFSPTTGQALHSIPRPGLTPITLQLQLGVTNGDLIIGTVSDGAWTANLAAAPEVYSKANPAPQAGKYTLLIPGSENASAQPGGNGFGSVTVGRLGGVSFNGFLGDGTPVTAATTVCSQGLWPFYASLYGGRGAILGWLSFTNDGISGGVNWFKLPQATAKLYPGGFTNGTEVVGSIYQHTNGLPLLGFTNGMFSFNAGNLAQGVTNQVSFGAAIQAASPSTNQLTFENSSGLFNASVINPQTGKLISVKGIVLQNQNLGAGFFLGTNESGSVLLTPAQ